MTTIKTEAAYNAAMERIEELILLVDDNTPLDDKHLIELDLLSGLVDDYENIHYPIKAPTFVEVIKLRMEEMGLTVAALAEMIGTTVSWLRKFLQGKTEPKLSLAKSISEQLNIDAQIVLG